MAYLGREPAYGAFERQSLTPDGSTTTFTLDYTVASTSSILVSVSGVIQEPNSAYTLANGGTQIAFTAAPDSGTTVFLIYMGIAYEGAIVGQASFTSFTELAETSADNDRFLVYDISAQQVKYIESQYLVGITSRTELAERAASNDEFLVYDTSASQIKKIQTSNIVKASVTRTATGNGSTTDFTVTSGVAVDNVLVTENGILQTPTTDYTISGTTLTFTTAPASGVAIQIRELPA